MSHETVFSLLEKKDVSENIIEYSRHAVSVTLEPIPIPKSDRGPAETRHETRNMSNKIMWKNSLFTHQNVPNQNNPVRYESPSVRSIPTQPTLRGLIIGNTVVELIVGVFVVSHFGNSRMSVVKLVVKLSAVELILN